jgi:ribosomal protein S16
MTKKIKKQFSRYLNYRIRLFRTGRRGKSFYKIVVVNWNNRIVSQLGYYNPHADGSKYKYIGLDRSACIKWLVEKKATPSYFIFFIFEKIGLVKYRNN